MSDCELRRSRGTLLASSRSTSRARTCLRRRPVRCMRLSERASRRSAPFPQARLDGSMRSMHSLSFGEFSRVYLLQRIIVEPPKRTLRKLCPRAEAGSGAAVGIARRAAKQRGRSCSTQRKMLCSSSTRLGVGTAGSSSQCPPAPSF